ncbi:MAG: ABC transporter permease [Anaerostipes sp.]|nr:ABC transporter permease [Anaerostipes sp.]
MRQKYLLGKNIWILMVLLFLYFPILLLAVYSFTDSTMIGSIRSFSLENYKVLFMMPELRDMIVGTVLLALFVAVISTILGTLGAIGFFYSKKRTRRPFEFINQIPVVNADVVTGFSICVLLIVFFGMDKSSFVPLIVGLVTLSVPFVYLSIVPRLKQMDPELYEAALDLGYTPGGALLKIVIPQLLSGIAAGFMMSITLTLDDYFISTYTKPATFDTISTYVVNATKGAQTDIKTALWALSTVIFLCVAVSVILMNLPKKKGEIR